MPIPSLYKPLIELLQDGTASGRVSWQVSPKQDECFVSVDDNSIYIAEVRVGGLSLTQMAFKPTKTVIMLKIGDEKGTIVDEFAIDEDDKDYKSASSLYRDAVRIAKKVDERVKRVTEQLEKIVKASDAKGLVSNEETPTLSMEKWEDKNKP